LAAGWNYLGRFKIIVMIRFQPPPLPPRSQTLWGGAQALVGIKSYPSIFQNVAKVKNYF